MDIELRQQYEEMGVEPSNEVIAKSLELCVEYRIEDAVEFVEQWIAFSISHLQSAEPTTALLLEFERKVLQSKKDTALASKKSKLPAAVANLSQRKTVPALDSNPLAIYGVSATEPNESVYDTSALVEGADEAMLDTYNVYHTPKAKSTVARTPARLADARFSPASYSPITGGTPRSHQGAASSGKIVYTFGNPAIINKSLWNAVQPINIQLRQLLLHEGSPLGAGKSVKYMFDCLPEKCEILGERVFEIGRALCRQEFGQETEFDLQQVDMHAQDTIKTVGIVYSEHGGALDLTSSMLVGSDEMRCRTVRLNLTRAKSVALFPGQVVLVEGINPRGDTLMVERLMTERALLPPSPPKCADTLSFVVAAGPYTHDDDLVYEPLNDLMTYLKGQTPHVLILTGPFLDSEHKLISGENTTLAETFDSFFEKMIAGIVDMIGTSTTILVIASHKDANADPVYPTIPLTLKKTYANVHILPDPSLVDLNGITIGATSTDIFNHIISNELAINAGDKVKRVVNHLFNQGSFYPLHPAEEDNVCFDSYLAQRYAKLEQIPNVLILPSEQKCFIRNVQGCLVINPGRVSEENGGTFARFVITPPAPKDEGNILNYVGCQVRKV